MTKRDDTVAEAVEVPLVEEAPTPKEEGISHQHSYTVGAREQNAYGEFEVMFCPECGHSRLGKPISISPAGEQARSDGEDLAEFGL